jgi:IPT/TIG domain
MLSRTGLTFRDLLISIFLLGAFTITLQSCAGTTHDANPAPPPAPSIGNLNVTSGAVGTPVTIAGTNFGATQGTSTVKFNGTAGVPTSWSATSIVVPVPAGATTGNVVVTVGGVASNGASFTVTSSGSISVTVSPKRGGATVTQQIPLTATVTNDVGAAGVTWSVSAGGTLTGQTTTAASFSAASAGVYTITATSVADVTEHATAMIGVTNLQGVYTYHDDLARDGANTEEYALTTSNVGTSTFGKLFSCSVDGAVYAQPIWVANLTVNGAMHNVVFVATQHDSLYAFDADASPCIKLWNVSLIDTNHGANSGEQSVSSGISGGVIVSTDITPEVGVTGTPVIDPTTNTLYVVSKSANSGGTSVFQRLHAIDITTGNEKFGGPMNINSSITYPGTGDGGATVSFNARQEAQRSGLTLVNGVVYVAWASHGDNAPYYGWVVGFNAANLSVASILNVSPNVGYGGIWMGGGAPSADANGNLYLTTGNAQFDVTSGGDDYGDSFLQLSSGLNVSSFFTPSDEATDDADDQDFGAGGSAIVLNLTSGTLRHLVIGGGKDGTLYLLNGDSMGGLGDSNARQHFGVGSGIFATGAFWNGNYYIAAIANNLLSYSFNSSTNLFNTSVASRSSTSYGFPGSTPSVSSTGSSNGIVWALDNSSYCTDQSQSCGPAVLHAYDATTLSSDLWNSSMVGADAAGNAVKFTVPTIANGKVYVGTRGNNTGGVFGSTTIAGELDVYGLKAN